MTPPVPLYTRQVCVGLSYVSTVYAITGAVQMAAERSLHGMHAALNAQDNSASNGTCETADWAVMHAVSWPVLMGTVSSVGAMFMLKFLGLDASGSFFRPDLVRGIVSTVAWAAVCVPATVLYDMATNRYCGRRRCDAGCASNGR